MRDIFGIGLHQYQTLSAFQEKGILQQQLQARCNEYLKPGRKTEKDFALQYATRKHKFYTPQEFETQLRASGSYGFMLNNFQAFVSMTEEIWYREFRLNDYVPVLTSGVAEGADSYAVVVKDMVGRGRVGPRHDGIVPTADVNLRKYSADLYLGEIDARYTEEDLRNSMYINQALNADKVEAAVQGANIHLEIMGFSGDPDIPGTVGLVNQPTSGTNATATRILPSNTLASGVTATDNWEAFTDDEKVVALNYMVSKIILDTKEIIVRRGRQGKADMVISLPPDIYDDVCTDSYGDNKDKTVKDYVDKSNAWKNRTGRSLIWMSTTELSEAGTPVTSGGNNSFRRIQVYVKDEAIMEFRIVIQPRIIRITRTPRETVLPYEYKFGELQIKRSDTMIYLDDI